MKLATRPLHRSFSFSVGATAEAKGSFNVRAGNQSPSSSRGPEHSSSKANFTASAQWGNTEGKAKNNGFTDRWKAFWEKIQSK